VNHLINLRYWRSKRKLTQLQLATLIGTTPGYIHEIENGKKWPTLKMLYKIANALDLYLVFIEKNEDYENKISE
jgi:transcriptional regulator with XRE-family HTH domain